MQSTTNGYSIAQWHQSSTIIAAVAEALATIESVIRKSIDQKNTFRPILNKQKRVWVAITDIQYRFENKRDVYTERAIECVSAWEIWNACMNETSKPNWTCAWNRLWSRSCESNQFWVVQKAILSILCINDSISSASYLNFLPCVFASLIFKHSNFRSQIVLLFFLYICVDNML